MLDFTSPAILDALGQPVKIQKMLPFSLPVAAKKGLLMLPDRRPWQTVLTSLGSWLDLSLGSDGYGVSKLHGLIVMKCYETNPPKLLSHIYNKIIDTYGYIDTLHRGIAIPYDLNDHDHQANVRIHRELSCYTTSCL